MTSQVTDNLVTFLGECCHLSSCFDRGQLKALGLHQLGEVHTDSKQESWGLTSEDGLTFPKKCSQGACCAKALKLEAGERLPHPSSACLLPLKAAAGSESQAPSGSGPWRWDRSGPNQVYSGTSRDSWIPLRNPTQGLLRSLGPDGSAEWGYPAVGRCHLATWWVLFCSAGVLSYHPWTSAQRGLILFRHPEKSGFGVNFIFFGHAMQHVGS